MPSLNGRRQVRYTASDQHAIDAALCVLEFMREFDDELKAGEAIAAALQATSRHITACRAQAMSNARKQAAKPAKQVTA